jgi:hypothetical protein
MLVRATVRSGADDITAPGAKAGKNHNSAIFPA